MTVSQLKQRFSTRETRLLRLTVNRQDGRGWGKGGKEWRTDSRMGERKESKWRRVRRT